MAMPDGVDALLQLAAAPRERLRRTAYNVGAFNPSAEEVRQVVLKAFPGAQITYDGGRAAAGDPGLVAGRRGRLRGAEGLGLRAEVRLRARVLGVPDPDDQEAVSEVAIAAAAHGRRSGSGSRVSAAAAVP